jgi:hypothetical protein
LTCLSSITCENSMSFWMWIMTQVEIYERKKTVFALIKRSINYHDNGIITQCSLLSFSGPVFFYWSRMLLRWISGVRERERGDVKRTNYYYHHCIIAECSSTFQFSGGKKNLLTRCAHVWKKGRIADAINKVSASWMSRLFPGYHYFIAWRLLIAA